MTRLRTVILVVALGISSVGCSGELRVNTDTIVAGNEIEARALERHRASDQARNAMLAILVIVVGPLGIATVIVLVTGRDRPTG